MATYEKRRMAVKHEIKSQLAKLLATEDLLVEHKKVMTAQFNVHTRVLTLPLWENASNTVYDLLVGHEVGHALFTPDEDPPENIPHQFINVVEDVRVEKLMKRKYMGLAKTFFNGYHKLHDDDFFSIDGEDISKMNLADRVNLSFKIGNFIDINFTEEEMVIVNMISECESFAEVLIAADTLYRYCVEQKDNENTEKIEDIDDLNFPPLPSQKNSTGQLEMVDENQPSNEDDKSEENIGNEELREGISDTEFKDTPDIHTANSLDEKLQSLIGRCAYENNYVQIPEVNLDTVIVSNSDIFYEIENCFNYQQKHKKHDLFEEPDQDYLKFKRSAQKEVNYLVKEFECKKAADSYARATTASTGVLDCSKLHTYKYNEDLFKKVTTLADGKNHGLVFVLDWSGSMQYTMRDTCKQLFNLIWFCKKVKIPFDVYAFTGEWNRAFYDYDQEKVVNFDLKPHYTKKVGLLSIHERFSMLNILTSKVSSKDFENQLLNIWRIIFTFDNSYRIGYNAPQRLSLSGTPLNESIIALHQIIPKFRQDNNLQKVHCIILTDGEANSIPYHVEVIRGETPYIGCRRINLETTFLQDRKIGSTYKFESYYHKFTEVLLKNLKDRFPYTNLIGIRILEGRDANNFIRMHYNQFTSEYDSIVKDWKKNRSINISNSGYDAYFGLSTTALSQDADFEVDDGATKAKIKSAFVKSLKTKKLNKKVLGEFISLVA